MARGGVVRTSAFLRGELVGTLRQPALLLTMVVGPFLVLFLFGLGYNQELPDLATIVVGSDSELTDRVDAYVREEEPSNIDYRGSTDDEEQALAELRDGEIDLVVVLPDAPVDTMEQGERAEIELHQRSLDPVTFSQMIVVAELAVHHINDDVLEQILLGVQEDTEGLGGQVATAREQVDDVRDAIGGGRISLVEEQAEPLASQLRNLADVMEQGMPLAMLFDLGREIDELVRTMRAGAEQLTQLAAANATVDLDEMAADLEAVDEALSQVQAIDPAVAVRPFRATVLSQTPEPVTLDRFFAPGLLALMIQHLGITFAALSLMRERRTGTLEMLRVAPASTGERLAGKTLAFLLLGGVTVAALAALVVLVFDVPLPVNWVGFVVLLILALLSSIGIGFLIASVSATDGQAVQFSMLFLLAAIFFSGLFMPLDRIEMPVEIVSWLMPATYAFVGLQDLMLLGQPTGWWLYVGPLAITVVAFAGARLLLPRRSATA